MGLLTADDTGIVLRALTFEVPCCSGESEVKSQDFSAWTEEPYEVVSGADSRACRFVGLREDKVLLNP